MSLRITEKTESGSLKDPDFMRMALLTVRSHEFYVNQKHTALVKLLFEFVYCDSYPILNKQGC